jgi:hypothetical protein
LAEKKAASISVNRLLLWGALSFFFLWLYGLPALAAGIYTLVKGWKVRKSSKKWKPISYLKYKWAMGLAVAGTFLSFLVFGFHLLALVSGGFIRF